MGKILVRYIFPQRNGSTKFAKPLLSLLHIGWGFNIMLALTTQCVGFGIAGLMRRYLVEPGILLP